MKYALSLVLGLLVGVCVALVGALYNPLVQKQTLSPLTVTDARTMTLSFSAAAEESIGYTNNGESNTAPYPAKIQQLWEQSIRQSYATATVMRDGRQRVAGIGIKISSASEDTRLLSGQILANSIWYVYLPTQGSFFIEQTENYWHYLREVMIPAYRSGGDAWAGTWLGNMTFGPGALGTSRISGGHGMFEGREMLGVESVAVRTWRVEGGALSADGQLLIELPDVADAEAIQADEQT